MITLPHYQTKELTLETKITMVITYKDQKIQERVGLNTRFIGHLRVWILNRCKWMFLTDGKKMTKQFT
jgi:hypothetical protein